MLNQLKSNQNEQHSTHIREGPSEEFINKQKKRAENVVNQKKKKTAQSALCALNFQLKQILCCTVYMWKRRQTRVPRVGLRL